MEVYVALDVATATEAAATARALADTGVGFAVGPLLLARSGAPTVTPLRTFGRVLADVRLGGAPGVVAAAARALASAGATAIVLGPGAGRAMITAVAEAIGPYGAAVVVAALHPELGGDDLDLVTGGRGRGRTVSRTAAALAGSGVMILGVMADVGVVAQVAPDLGVIVTGIRTPEEARDAATRRAAGIVVSGDVVDAADAVGSIRPFVEAAGLD